MSPVLASWWPRRVSAQGTHLSGCSDYVYYVYLHVAKGLCELHGATCGLSNCSCVRPSWHKPTEASGGHRLAPHHCPLSPNQCSADAFQPHVAVIQPDSMIAEKAMREKTVDITGGGHVQAVGDRAQK